MSNVSSKLNGGGVSEINFQTHHVHTAWMFEPGAFFVIELRHYSGDGKTKSGVYGHTISSLSYIRYS